MLELAVLYDNTVVRPAGFEPATPRLGIWRSILLSYGRKGEGDVKTR